MECAYQGSKVFERGGPYTDLYSVDVRTAKRDPRLKESGRLTGFLFEGFKFPLEPKTVFYDWLSLLSGQSLNKFNWLPPMTNSEPSAVCKITDSIEVFSNTVTENTCINV